MWKAADDWFDGAAGFRTVRWVGLFHVEHQESRRLPTQIVQMFHVEHSSRRNVTRNHRIAGRESSPVRWSPAAESSETNPLGRKFRRAGGQDERSAVGTRGGAAVEATSILSTARSVDGMEPAVPEGSSTRPAQTSVGRSEAADDFAQEGGLLVPRFGQRYRHLRMSSGWGGRESRLRSRSQAGFRGKRVAPGAGRRRGSRQSGGGRSPRGSGSR